jgi:hypothetical protein
MKLTELNDEELRADLAVRVDGEKEIYNYSYPTLSPSRKLCDWGSRAGAKPGIGDWIDVNRIDVVEVLK